MCKLNIFDKLSFLLVLIGSLNWGTIGLLDFNIVNFFCMGIPILERIIYVIVCAAALNLVSLLFRCNIISFDN
ncbi:MULTISPECIES: DUF378 domain-containing protein [Clostridium]|jgi:hypothetical protein|uniref:DUF378 domain-containing protein n=2 Tax=Clostridium butyricum TaxID=1492 RepID=A0A0A6Q0H3_CLOBU|nr:MULTISPECIES: DUF378 domain-containing protein [Clostridium]ETI91395.1 MAG: hypothetical protein Q607_CBUC00030G0123 [Clostridium butyricum DORA_1]ALP90035.1 DUF378 domain-containing protein [Clostridium butyricum]ALS16488.1 DUF378 domain-containing protein [Clostridium butyricum]ANF13652.1 DUF378 domain-containing protein [Clostridium butyricum]AOR93719.1 DUF378 domain-containing protein [Clostridium butyricum]